VDPSDVAGGGEGGDGDIGDVVCVDERLGDLVAQHGEPAGGEFGSPQALGEVLQEERRSDDRPFGTRGDQGLLGPPSALLSAAGQQHQSMASCRDSGRGELADDLVGARDGEVGLVCDVRGIAAGEGCGPAAGVGPVETRLARARADANGHAACGKAFGHSAAGLAAAAEHQCGFLNRHVVHGFSSGRSRTSWCVQHVQRSALMQTRL
jgi:hypothetical protein